MPECAGAYRRWKRLECFELRIMRVMAVNTEQILFVPVPVTGTLAVNADLPVTELVTVALAAQSVRLVKTNQLAGYKSQFVPIQQVVAISTPALPFGMMKHYVGVKVCQSPPLRIRFH